MSAPRYRVCLSEAPHCGTWWTVDKLTFGFWWRRQKQFVYSTYTGGYFTDMFITERLAREWVLEDRKARTHVCSEVGE